MPSKDKYEKERELLFSAIAESVIEASDEEILEETKEQDIDPDKVANETKKIFQSAILKHKKKRLNAAREEFERKTHAGQQAKTVVGSIEEKLLLLKNWISSKSEQNMGEALLQFRDYESMEPEDVDSAIEQLIQLGEIDPDDL